MIGVFTCRHCPHQFEESLPPIWLSYWPQCCGDFAQLQCIQDESQTVAPQARLRSLILLVCTYSMWLVFAIPLVGVMQA